jgi:hypothetical protein
MKNKHSMKKTVIILSVLALIVGGCRQAITQENIPQIQEGIIFQYDTLLINGLQLIKTSDSDTTNNFNLFYCLTTIDGDTIIPYAEFYHYCHFLDIDDDGYTDLRVEIFSHTFNQCDNYLFDSRHKTFRHIENCILDIQKISGTDFYYSYEAVGCADMNWESLLSKIENYRLVPYAIISGYGCEDQKFIIVNKFDVDKNTKLLKGKKIFAEEQEIFVANQLFIENFPYTENIDKWDFIKNYWKTNYQNFE